MNVSDDGIKAISESLIRVEEQVRNLTAGILTLQQQVASYYTSGHRDTPLHCDQLRRCEADILAIKADIEAAKDRDRVMMTKIAVITTAITLGGGTAVNMVLKAIM
jgi:hypothetical protein